MVNPVNGTNRPRPITGKQWIAGGVVLILFSLGILLVAMLGDDAPSFPAASVLMILGVPLGIAAIITGVIRLRKAQK